MVNQLTTLREDVAQVLRDAGIKSFHYQEERFTPPCALVVPSENYVTIREGDPFGSINVAIQLLLIGEKATAKAGTEKFDEMILTALKALGEEFDVIDVLAPDEITHNEVSYWASVISIEVQIRLGKEN